MYVSAHADYAVRAMLAIAARTPRVVKTAVLAEAQDIPQAFLQGILVDLRNAVCSIATEERMAATCWRVQPIASALARFCVRSSVR